VPSMWYGPASVLFSGPIASGEDLLPRSLERIDEILDLVGVELPLPLRLEAYDLDERILEDIEAAVGREDDLEPAEDAVGDAGEVSVDGGKRQDLVCGRDVGLIDLDFENRRRIGALLCKTAGDPDLRDDSSRSGRILSRKKDIVLCRAREVFFADRMPSGFRPASRFARPGMQ